MHTTTATPRSCKPLWWIIFYPDNHLMLRFEASILVMVLLAYLCYFFLLQLAQPKTFIFSHLQLQRHRMTYLLSRITYTDWLWTLFLLFALTAETSARSTCSFLRSSVRKQAIIRSTKNHNAPAYRVQIQNATVAVTLRRSHVHHHQVIPSGPAIRCMLINSLTQISDSDVVPNQTSNQARCKVYCVDYLNLHRSGWTSTWIRSPWR